MQLNTFRAAFRYTVGLALVCAASVTATLAIEPVSAHDPLDATAAVPAPTYQSVLSGHKGRYLTDTDVDRLQWRRLFEPDGRFASSPQSLSGSLDKATPNHVPKQSVVPAAPDTASDARGIIRSIDIDRARVKLKHGPIAKFDMPGMTMIFRVRDTRILEQISKGDEVGVTVEMDRGALYITGFQK